MSLPVDLTAGWASITLLQSPNGITASEDAVGSSMFGVIDSVIPTVRPELEAGQNVMFKVAEKQLSVNYSNATYFIVEEKNIVFIEQEVTPP